MLIFIGKWCIKRKAKQVLQLAAIRVCKSHHSACSNVYIYTRYTYIGILEKYSKAWNNPVTVGGTCCADCFDQTSHHEVYFSSSCRDSVLYHCSEVQFVGRHFAAPWSPWQHKKQALSFETETAAQAGKSVLLWSNKAVHSLYDGLQVGHSPGCHLQNSFVLTGRTVTACVSFPHPSQHS